MLHPIRLGRIAAEAEGVRLRALAQRTVNRVLFGAIALLFVTGALVCAHVAAWFSLRVLLDFSFLAATGIVGGADLLIGIVLGLLAARSIPSRVEVEALAVRRQAIHGMASMRSLTSLIPAIFGLLATFRRRR
jgi:hypothetical protein